MKRGSKKNRLLDFYVGIPFLFLASGFRRKRKWPPSIRRIGIFPNPALGDTLLCAGPIADLRLAFPKSEIILLITRSNNSAASLIPGVDNIVNISVSNPWQSIRAIRALQLDLLVDFTSWQRVTAAISAFSNARFVVGYYTANQFRHFAYDRTAEHRNDRHELDNHRALAACIGAVGGTFPQLIVPLATLDEIIDAANDLVVFHPWPSGMRSWLREWPDERWIELAMRLNRPGRLFVITGSPQDEPRARSISEKLMSRGAETHVFVGREGLASVARLLIRAKLLVSVNTGIMHLGALLGTPTVSINGPTAQHRWGPVGQCVAGVDTPGCSGGFLHLGFEFEGNPTDTMERISAQQVFEAAEYILRRRFAREHC